MFICGFELKTHSNLCIHKPDMHWYWTSTTDAGDISQASHQSTPPLWVILHLLNSSPDCFSVFCPSLHSARDVYSAWLPLKKKLIAAIPLTACLRSVEEWTVYSCTLCDSFLRAAKWQWQEWMCFDCSALLAIAEVTAQETGESLQWNACNKQMVRLRWL